MCKIAYVPIFGLSVLIPARGYNKCPTVTVALPHLFHRIFSYVNMPSHATERSPRAKTLAHNIFVEGAYLAYDVTSVLNPSAESTSHSELQVLLFQ